MLAELIDRRTSARSDASIVSPAAARQYGAYFDRESSKDELEEE